jgi:hypothetical protein
MKNLIKFLTLIIAIAVVLGVVATAQPVQAAQLTGAKSSLSDSRPATSSTHTFSFTASTTATLREIRFVYATTASTGTTKPNGLTTTTGTLGTLVNLNAGWSLDASSDGTLRVQHVGAGQSITSGTTISIPINSITNHAIDDCQAGGDASSDTCFVRITTYSDLGSTSVDTTIVTYTVVEAVTVTARVDPTFTFVVAAVGASTVNNAITTSAASTYSTLPFSNLTAGTPRYLAHKLNVTTNSNSGYSVTMKMLSQMAGTYSGNNIDPFASGSVSWSAPAAWAEPTGATANTNTGWIGANTTDTDISQFDSGEFGPVESTANTVMSSTTSDNGNTSIYVTYAIEANVYQPADTYTGTVVYNALPTY